jgi:hypothetical protein
MVTWTPTKYIWLQTKYIISNIIEFFYDEMRLSSGGDDDAVQIQLGNKPGEPFIITVNCPDKTGLACDICRFILHFGLCILKGGRYY